MPYRRRYNRRYKKRRYNAPKYTYGGMMKKVWNDIKYLKGLINVEKKYLDVSGTLTPVVALSASLLNGIAQGDTSITRDGDSVKIVSLLINFNFVMNASASASRIRIIILRDKQSNAAAPAGSVILESDTNILSPRNIDYGKRFKVYKDFMVVVNTDFPEKAMKIVLSKLKFHTKYIDGGATIASIATNSLYLLAMSDEGTNTPSINYYSRIRYIDN